MILRNFLALIALTFTGTLFAQDASAPSPSATATETPTPTATVARVRQVRITFLPPPLEGTISLGIYDGNGKLVRVLHREAEVSDFEAGADALQTKWDGLDDAGQPAPAGKYHARGYTVGDLHVDESEESPNETTTATSTKAAVKLVANPLAGEKRATVELAAGYDEDGTFLETADGLPLFSVDEMPGVFSATLTKRSEKLLEFVQNDGDSIDRFRITNFEQMMAFDCGEISLK